MDVGEVDLIICFDISQHSPIRLVQRMGRTGRKRDGHIIVLVTDGKEHEVTEKKCTLFVIFFAYAHYVVLFCILILLSKCFAEFEIYAFQKRFLE